MNNHKKHIATHEAGHVVADYRIWGSESQLDGWVTIIPNLENGTLGAASGPGAGHCSNEADAAKVVILYLAGYGALIAAGYDEESAIYGCGSDLDEAGELIEFWSLDGVDFWKRQAVDVMSKPENRKAVEVVTRSLIENKTLDLELAHALIEVADGESTEEDLRRYLHLRELHLNQPPG